MAQVKVTLKFKEDFDTWAHDRIRFNEFTQADMAEFKEMLRKDLLPGEDQLRQGLEYINAAGVTVPAMIDNYEDRIKLWTAYFAECAQEIRSRQRKAA